MKFIKKNRVNLVVVLILLIAVYAIVYMKQQNLYQNNPGLIPPAKNYDISVDLTEQQRSGYEAKIKEYDDLINNFVPSTGEQIIDLGSGLKAHAGTVSRPKAERFFNKSEYLQDLGRYTEAIKTYNEFFKDYENDEDGLAKLGNLYEKLDESQLAILMFTKLLEINPKYQIHYYRAIVEHYLKLKNPEQAGQRYIKYEANGGKRDEVLMNDIKSMKSQQK